MPELTAQRVRDVLTYDSETGLFRRLSNGRGAGTLRPSGYTAIYVDDRTYLAHRLAWLYVYGHMPDGEIDHINGLKSDNRIINLRAVAHALNAQNRRAAQRDSKTGILGVVKHRARYRAQITVGGRCMVVGSASTPEAAHALYLEAKRRLHEGCTI